MVSGKKKPSTLFKKGVKRWLLARDALHGHLDRLPGSTAIGSSEKGPVPAGHKAVRDIRKCHGIKIFSGGKRYRSPMDAPIGGSIESPLSPRRIPRSAIDKEDFREKAGRRSEGNRCPVDSTVRGAQECSHGAISPEVSAGRGNYSVKILVSGDRNSNPPPFSFLPKKCSLVAGHQKKILPGKNPGQNAHVRLSFFCRRGKRRLLNTKMGPGWKRNGRNICRWGFFTPGKKDYARKTEKERKGFPEEKTRGT